MRGVVLRRGWQGGEEYGRDQRGEWGVIVLHQVERYKEELIPEAHSEEDWLWVEVGSVDEKKGDSVENAELAASSQILQNPS